jgi:hypothetical protein
MSGYIILRIVVYCIGIPAQHHYSIMQSDKRFTSDTICNVSYWVNNCHYKCTVSELAYIPINTESVAISHNIYPAAAKHFHAQINIDLISLQSVQQQCGDTLDNKYIGEYRRRWRWP